MRRCDNGSRVLSDVEKECKELLKAEKEQGTESYRRNRALNSSSFSPVKTHFRFLTFRTIKL